MLASNTAMRDIQLQNALIDFVGGRWDLRLCSRSRGPRRSSSCWICWRRETVGLFAVSGQSHGLPSDAALGTSAGLSRPSSRRGAGDCKPLESAKFHHAPCGCHGIERGGDPAAESSAGGLDLAKRSAGYYRRNSSAAALRCIRLNGGLGCTGITELRSGDPLHPRARRIGAA